MSVKRSNTFVTTPARQRLLDHPGARLNQDRVEGPISWLNPTRALFDILPAKAKTDGATSPERIQSGSVDPTKEGLPSDTQLRWRARDNRKGRHVLVIPPGTEKKPEYPDLTASFKGVAKGIWRMCTVFAWWDISWWIGVLFSIGSAIFIACGFFYWLPLAAPSSEFKGEDTVAGGVTAFVGATLFQIGAILLIIEACNENQSGCFGWALVQAFSNDGEGEASSNEGGPVAKAVAACEHHHAHGVHKRSTIEKQHPNAGRKWEWWPTWHELTTHYFHEIGFLGSFILAVGATIFYVSGILALPGIYDHLPQGVLYGIYWLTYLVGGILFVVSSGLYMIETQPNWYTPAPGLLGWWIGVWNMIGSIGWTLSASFGYCSASWCGYQSDLSLTWASIAFTIGSLLLWYEALDKYPVERA